jgi:vacuolar-type H+-ATPase subunit H
MAFGIPRDRLLKLLERKIELYAFYWGSRLLGFNATDLYGLNLKYADKMSQEKQLKSIEEVQEAETSATERLADANKEMEKAVSAAREKASAVVADALSDAKLKRENAVKKVIAELDKERKKALDKAVKESKSIKTRRLSQQKRKEVARKLVNLILGE